MYYFIYENEITGKQIYSSKGDHYVKTYKEKYNVFPWENEMIKRNFYPKYYIYIPESFCYYLYYISENSFFKNRGIFDENHDFATDLQIDILTEQLQNFHNKKENE